MKFYNYRHTYDAGGGNLYTFGEADGGKLGLGKNVTSEADQPTRVDIPDESVRTASSFL